MPNRSIAVLGGGISGLSAAYTLARALPSSQITLIEGSKRLGGWMQSHKNEGGIIFESGPRTMRPKGLRGWSTIALIDQLGLSESILTVSKSHESAKNRFIYYPDRLNKLPSSLLSLFTALRQPALKGLIPYALKEPFQPKGKETDESVDSFFRRRFGPHVAENMISAMIRGIYAGDSRQLSIRAIFPSLWEMERKHGSIIKGMLTKTVKNAQEEAQIESYKAGLSPSLRKDLEDCSVWGLVGGMQTLATHLEQDLKARSNVKFLLNTKAEKISISEDGKHNLHLSDQTIQADNIVSSIPSPALSNLFPALPHLKHNPSVSVGVVNLSYQTSSLLPVKGFGYLIPRSTPPTQNPHKALGVVFDSDSMPTLHPTGTNLSILLGGHQYSSSSEMPDEATLVRQGIDTVRLHLGVEEEPALALAHRQVDCIPQYQVGHVERMQELHEALDRIGGLSVVGASYDGVGVNDCIWSGLQTAERLIREGRATGLESVAKQ